MTDTLCMPQCMKLNLLRNFTTFMISFIFLVWWFCSESVAVLFHVIKFASFKHFNPLNKRGQGKGREDWLRRMSHTCMSWLDVRKERVEFSALGGGTERGNTTQREGRGEGGGGSTRRFQIFPTCGVGATGVIPKLPCLSRLNTSFHKTMSRMKVYGIVQWVRERITERLI